MTAAVSRPRWRCALFKEGVPSELLHLPWIWNKSVMIAYVPATSFFKANNEYAHGGISPQECLVTVIDIETYENSAAFVVV